jgi:hypothetical protein
MKRQPFALPYAGIHKEADLSGNYASAAPVEPAVGDYIADALGGLGIPREQALKLGSAFGLFPDGFRESGRALAAPFFEPTAGNIAGAGVEAALTAIPGAKGAKVAADAAEGAAKKAIKAYHGSPHDFDRFSLDKIGTGEGAQAYGHGLYFAEAEDTAKSYRDQLSRSYKIDDGKFFPATNAERDFENMLDANGGDIDRMIGNLSYYRGMSDDTSQRYVRALDVAEKIKAEGRYSKIPGRMYEVNINADPEHFLDWDKPLSQQSEKVRGALSGFPQMNPAPVKYTQNGRWHTLRSGEAEWDLGAVSGGFQQFTNAGPLGPVYKTIDEAKAAIQSSGPMNDAYASTLMTRLGSGPYGGGEASQALREAGIPGIRYLDQGSRGAGEGSSNYVVFDDKLVEILRKYGIALPFGLGAAGAGALGKGPDEPETY